MLDYMISPHGPEHVDALVRFLQALDAEDRTFVREDLDDPDLVRLGAQIWAEQHAGRYLVATTGQNVAGFCGVTRGSGWSAHVGSMRLVVDRAARGHGLGSRLALAGLQQALGVGFEKVVVEVLSDQDSVVNLFQRLGFRPEALLVDHVRDAQGRGHDLLTLAHHRDDITALIQTMGLGAA